MVIEEWWWYLVYIHFEEGVDYDVWFFEHTHNNNKSYLIQTTNQTVKKQTNIQNKCDSGCCVYIVFTVICWSHDESVEQKLKTWIKQSCTGEKLYDVVFILTDSEYQSSCMEETLWELKVKKKRGLNRRWRGRMKRPAERSARLLLASGQPWSFQTLCPPEGRKCDEATEWKTSGRRKRGRTEAKLSKVKLRFEQLNCRAALQRCTERNPSDLMQWVSCTLMNLLKLPLLAADVGRRGFVRSKTRTRGSAVGGGWGFLCSCSRDRNTTSMCEIDIIQLRDETPAELHRSVFTSISLCLFLFLSPSSLQQIQFQTSERREAFSVLPKCVIKTT